MSRLRVAFIIAVLFVTASTAGAQQNPWRPTIMGQRGMVASGHPLASEAGLRILREGGNAIDAAIATWLVQGQVEPGMTGLGADFFALIYLAKTGEVKFINGSGPAPKTATADFYRSKGGMPRSGPLSVEVPGAVGGVLLTHQKYGTKPIAEVMQPALEIAERGFPVTDTLAGQLRSNQDLLSQYPSTQKIWFKNGEPARAGDIVQNPDLARTLRTIAQGGDDAFYRGPIAKATVEFLKTYGGLHELSDWAGYEAHEDTPISVTYRGLEVFECPPNSQGHVMLQALNILEGFSLRYMEHNSAPYLHLVTEALKLSFADRNRFNGDPRFVAPIPMRELLSKEYAARRRALIDPSRAIQGEPPPGDPRAFTSSGDLAYAGPRPVPNVVSPWDENELALTTYLTVVDEDHNMVSITSSLLSGFGSGMVVDGAGYLLNNRMAYFSLEAGDPNVLAPGKRTRQTINPALALKDGKPYVVFGTPGADTQPQTQLQFLLNIVEFGMGVQQALEAPAVISSSFRSSYYPQRVDGKLQTPAALPEHVRAGLAARGHDLDIRNARGVGSVKAILIHPQTGALMGGVSPTGDSYVMGW